MKDKITAIFWIYSIFYVALAIAGGIRQYSPVPHWDMLDGYLFFDSIVRDAPWTAWFMQHNEHRIFFSRLLFWIDIHIFHGRSWFLISMNYALLLAIFFVFKAYLNETPSKKPGYLLPFMLAWLFTWAQNENLAWGFQSQFFMAYLFPLLSFYFIKRAAENPSQSTTYFSLSLTFAIFSLGTMANGVLALPILALCTITLKLDWRQSLTVFTLAIFGTWLYFHNYDTPPGHGNAIKTLSEHPIDALRYITLYMGNPFYYFLNGSFLAKGLAYITGSLFLYATIKITIKTIATYQIPTISSTAYNITNLGFILYTGGTALGTAGGRLFQGVDQALSSRYVTAALMSWITLILLYTPTLTTENKQFKGKLWIPFGLLALGMLPQQLSAVKSPRAGLVEKEIAALALELGVHDTDQIHQIYPNAERALILTEDSVNRNISIFGIHPFQDARDVIGAYKSKTQIKKDFCTGGIIEIKDIKDDPAFVKIVGIINFPRASHLPRSLLISDGTGLILGIALVDRRHIYDLNIKNNSQNNSAWFHGYLKMKSALGPLKLIDEGSGCLINLGKL